jgi:hypothetical protein
MILEVAILNVRQGQAAEFEEAFAVAKSIFSHMPGYISHELQHCIEVENKYLLLVPGNGSKITRKGLADQPSIRNGNACSIIFTIPSPRLSITREYDARMLIEVLL